MTEPTREDKPIVDQAAESQAVPTGSEPLQTARGGGLGASLSVLALLVAAGAGAAAFVLWQQGQTRLEAVETQLQALSGELSALSAHPAIQELRRELRLETQALNDAEDQFRQRLDTVEQAVGTVHDLTTRSQRGWVLAEVEYLMRIANDRLRLMRDFEGAIAALTGADQRLHELADPTLLPVREALADEIQALRGFSQPDTVGIALRLDRMISGLRPLPLAVPELEAPAQAPTETDEEEKSWTGFLRTVWQELNRQVTIRHHGEPVRGLPDPEAELYIHQMLRLRLEAARLSVLRLDDAEFHRQLAAARGWVEEHYRGEDAEALEAELAELDGVDLRPELPEITTSLQRLRALSAARAKVEAPGR